jgi:histidine triad (HIT) family protein
VDSGQLDLPRTDRCAFCDYLSGKRDYTILVRTRRTATLVTREQRGIGHLLVLPIDHVSSLLELDDRDGTAVMRALRRAARAIDGAYGRPGISVWQNNGLAAGQAIPHLHFHVAGTLPSGETERGPVDEISIEETDTIAALLRPYL